jgi:hypothetical protein
VKRIQCGGGNPERKKPHGIPKMRGENNIKMELQEVGCEVWTRRN